MPTRFDRWMHDRRWTIPIVLPVALALVLVLALAAQAVRIGAIHRRAVAAALHDYAGFVAWQYARRASDYLRLTISTNVPYAAMRGIPTQGVASAIVRDGRIDVLANHTGFPDTSVARGFAAAYANAARSSIRIGLVELDDGHDARFLGYVFRRDAHGEWTMCEAVPFTTEELTAVFTHVAAFAPLLPPSVVGSLPRDSLVYVQLFTAGGATVAAIGSPTAGLSAADRLGPDLAGLRVIATLYPVAERRLVAAPIAPNDQSALGAALAVTVVLCIVAVLQVRRTQEIVRVRSDFVASVSQELKTPLTQISLFADTLAAPRDRPTGERREFAAIISREAKRLGHLVDGILHFARMTNASTSIAATGEAAFLGEEVRAAIAGFAPIASGRGVALHLSIDRDAEMSLERDAFRQAMLNLLDNAFKFGPDRQTIGVAVECGAGWATIRVDDCGPGIPAADRDRAFDPYVRLDTTSRVGGSGIGLAVVRDVVRRHAGTVRVMESPGGGTRIEITLPLNQSTRALRG